MKTIKLIIFGTVIATGACFGQVNNTDVNINMKTDTVVKRDTVVKEVPVPAPAPQVAEAPKKEEPPFHSGEFGVRFMPTFSSLTLRNSNGGTVKGDFVVGYGYGALLALNGKHVGVQLEAIYNSMSQKYKDGSLERKIDINYVNVPLLLTLNTDKSKCVNFSVAAGPQLGINVGSKVTTSGGGDTDTLKAVLALKQADFGFAYGAGLEFALNPARTFRFNVGFRGVYGLIDISDKSKTKTTNQYYILDRTNIETYSGYAGLSILF